MSGCAGTPPARDHSVPSTGSCAEEVLGEPVDRAQQLGLDAVHDHRRVGRDRAGVVGDQQRAAVAGDVLEALPLGPEPVPVDRVVEGAGERAQALAAAPGVDVAAGSSSRAPVRRGRARRPGRRRRRCARGIGVADEVGRGFSGRRRRSPERSASRRPDATGRVTSGRGSAPLHLPAGGAEAGAHADEAGDHPEREGGPQPEQPAVERRRRAARPGGTRRSSPPAIASAR